MKNAFNRLVHDYVEIIKSTNHLSRLFVKRLECQPCNGSSSKTLQVDMTRDSDTTVQKYL